MNYYKFKSLEHLEHALDLILNERLYCTDYNKLNDPFEGLFFSIVGSFSSAFSKDFDILSKKIKFVLEKFKICSLSKELSDVRMWSYYANDHKGIAVEIDFKGFEEDIRQVQYSAKLPEYNLGNYDPAPLEILTKKTDHWFYESEYRVIQEDEYYSVKGRIKNIYLGQGISDDLIEMLKKIIPTSIPIYSTKLDQNEIKIIPNVRINYEGNNIKNS